METRSLRCIIFFRLGAACPSNYNPADYFVQMLAVVPGRELACRHAIKTTCDTFWSSEYGRKIVTEAETVHGEFESFLKYHSKDAGRSPYKASWCEQFHAVLWRSWLSVIKEPLLIKVRLLQTIVRFPPKHLWHNINSTSFHEKIDIERNELEFSVADDLAIDRCHLLWPANRSRRRDEYQRRSVHFP